MPNTPLITLQIAELTARVSALEAGDLPCPYDPDDPDEPIPSILNAAKHWTTDHTCRVAIELLRMAEPRLEAEGRGYTFLVWYDAEPDNVLHAARNQVDGLEVVESTRTERTDAPKPKSDL